MASWDDPMPPWLPMTGQVVYCILQESYVPTSSKKAFNLNCVILVIKSHEFPENAHSKSKKKSHEI